MTFEDKARELMSERGMFPNDIETVLERIKNDEANESLKSRWHDHIEGYPQPVTTALLWFTVRTHVVEWIDEHKPNFWFRPLFVPKSEGGEA